MIAFFLIGAIHTLEDVICIIIQLLAEKHLCDSVHLHTENQYIILGEHFGSEVLE